MAAHPEEVSPRNADASGETEPESWVDAPMNERAGLGTAASFNTERTAGTSEHEARTPHRAPPGQPFADEAEVWVRGELIRNLMANTRGAHWMSGAFMPAVVVLGWGFIPPWQLLVWLSLGVMVTLGRAWAEHVYNTRYASRSGVRQERFVQKYGWFWSAAGFVWGLSILLFFERTPLSSQFLCWLIVAGITTFSVTGLSLYPPLLRAFLNTVFLTVLVAILLRIVELGFHGPNIHWGFLLMAVVYWRLLLRAGVRMHEAHRNNLELLYHNHVLINSLTQQRHAAVSAVAMKNRFLASAAHDMRQPVLALSLYADWLRNEPELVEEISPKIVRATRAVNTLFDSLFDLARFDTGQVTMKVEPIELENLLHDLELQYQPLAEAKGLDFRVRRLPGKVNSDPVRLRRMIGNLVANAIKYTEWGGVLLAARNTHRGIEIQVWDTGIGIAREHRRDVFQEFYKVTDQGGTSDGFGLGLAIVARLSQALGHRVSMRSVKGRGSVFKVLLKDADPNMPHKMVHPGVG